MEVKRGDIVVADLTGIGSVQIGERPCIVIQNNMGNMHSTTLIVVPLTMATTKRSCQYM